MLEIQLAELDSFKYVVWDEFQRDLNCPEPLMSNTVNHALPFLLSNFVAAREMGWLTGEFLAYFGWTFP